jgi:hypothetical protein
MKESKMYTLRKTGRTILGFIQVTTRRETL